MDLNGPLSIFPAEVWELIIDQMDNSVDRFHTLVSLSDLDSTLHKQKPKWYFGNIIPPIGFYLSTTNLRSTRQVCKMWHCDLHNLIDHHSYHVPYNADPQNGLPLNTVEVNKNCSLFKLATSNPVLKFCTVGSIKQFMETLANSQFSHQQIYGRTLFLDAKQGNSQENFNRSSIDLFKKVGSEINHLTISSHRDFETTLEFYKRLRLLLELTPNLKSLSIQFENQDDTRNLSLIMARRPLPSLRFLQSIRMDYDRDGVARDIFDCILSLAEREGSRVRKLIIPEYPSSFHRVDFTNITELEIRHSLDVGLLQQLKGSKIQQLVVPKLSILPHIKIIDLSELRVLHTRGIYIHENCSLHLPKLHTLRVMDRECESYNFLLQLKSLTQLEIEKDEENINDRLDKVALFGVSEITREIVNRVYWGPSKNFKVWDRLPTLKKIRIGTLKDTYTKQSQSWTTFYRQ